MTKPLLSIGMIVKNEERCLEKCLKALEPLRQALPCEIIIADTGSVDRTKVIANKYADIVFDFEWVNDFSVARNEVMDKANGKWYLTVDADEYLNSSVDEIKSFLTGELSDKKKFATIIQRNFTEPSMNGAYSDFNALRMCRLDTNERYHGSIHESFNVTNYDEIQVLSNTVFDHDGYTEITPQHLKEKEKRNLTLLGGELETHPDDIRCVLLCLESATLNKEKRRYFYQYALDKILNTDVNNLSGYDVFGAPCISIVLEYAIEDNHPQIEKLIDVAFENFGDNPHTLVDVNFFCSRYLINKQDYSSCIKYCEVYVKELEKQKRSNSVFLATPVKCSGIKYTTEIYAHIINSYLNLGLPDKATDFIKNLDLTNGNTFTFKSLLCAVLNENATECFIKEIIKAFNEFLKLHYSKQTNTNEAYNAMFEVLSEYLSVKNCLPTTINNLSGLVGSIGISVKISGAKGKNEVESYLSEIDNYQELLIIALKQILLMQVDLPERFFVAPKKYLSKTIEELCFVINDLLPVLAQCYLKEEKCSNDYPYTSFFFNLLSTILFSDNINLNNECRKIILDVFSTVSGYYLKLCYNSKVLNNEEFIMCLPDNHIFAYYLNKANMLKECNPLEYIKTLKTILNIVPETRSVIVFLMEELKKKEELKRQEKIKNASPELLVLAEQLKTMLAAFPSDSPELLAIKQSPVYKQVAFLIGD